MRQQPGQQANANGTLAGMTNRQATTEDLGGSSCVVGVLDRRQKPPQEFIEEKLQRGQLFPDEHDPYDASSFHGNFKGYEMGHRDQHARKQWFETMNAKLARFETWENVNIHEVDADYAMKYGDHALGTPFPFSTMKPKLEAERDTMYESYATALKACRERSPESWQELTSDPAFSTRALSSTAKPEQPVDTLDGVYRGCLACLGELWDLTEQIAKAGGSSDVSWSIKKLLRCAKKLAEKYDGHPCQITDIARTSIVFDEIEAIVAGLKFSLREANIVRLKNRFKDPELGYSDILLNAKMSNGFIVEVQLHLRSVHYVKGTNGHKAFKWLRRLVRENDVYEGDRDDDGLKHGEGKWWGANGDFYRGQWVHDKKHGHGEFVEADGHKYVGGFVGDKREGHCVFTYFDGSQYEGSYKNDKKDGAGVFSYADGQRYEGQWSNGKRHGKGTFTYHDGSRYAGEWVNHKRHGLGTLTDKTGASTVGNWKDDQLVSGFWGSCFTPFTWCARVSCPTGSEISEDAPEGSFQTYPPATQSIVVP